MACLITAIPPPWASTTGLNNQEPISFSAKRYIRISGHTQFAYSTFDFRANFSISDEHRSHLVVGFDIMYTLECSIASFSFYKKTYSQLLLSYLISNLKSRVMTNGLGVYYKIVSLIYNFPFLVYDKKELRAS